MTEERIRALESVGFEWERNSVSSNELLTSKTETVKII